MAQSLTNFDNALKEFYEGAIRETVNNDVIAFRELDESDRQWSGRRVIFPFHTSRNSGIGARPEGGTLPDAGNQGYEQSVVSATYQYGVIQLSGQVLEAGRNAFADAMQEEMGAVSRDLVNDLGRQAWGDGTGRLCEVATSANAGASTQITVFNRFTAPGHNGGRYLLINQLIDGGTTADPDADFSSAVITGVTISESPGTTTDTVAASGGGMSAVSAGNFLFNKDAGGNEMMGMLGLIDNFSATNIYSSTGFAGSSVQGINRASVSNFNSIVLGNSSVERIVTPQLMQKAFDRIHVESGLEPDIIWGHHDTIRALLENVTADRRYNSPEFAVGASSLTFNGIKLTRDRQCPYNSLYVLNRSILKMYTLSDLKFADKDGSILSRAASSDAYTAFLRCYKNLGLDGNPKGACVIRDIKVDF